MTNHRLAASAFLLLVGPSLLAACSGEDGAPGADGAGAIVTAEPAGANCAAGGVKVQVGDADPTYVCNAPVPVKYYVFVRGHLKSDDMAVNKATHDAIVAAARPTVTPMGDEKHLALLGLTDPRNLLVIDVWNSLEGLQAFLADPDVQAAFGNLFDAPPDVSVTVPAAGYDVWGELTPKPGTWVVSVRGTFAGDTATWNEAAHNQAAAAGKPLALSLGDYGHLAFLRTDDPSQFQAIDEWDSLTGLDTYVANAEVQARFAALFAAAPTIDVYTTSDFSQY